MCVNLIGSLVYSAHVVTLINRGILAKALELFLAMIVEESSKVTVDRGAKKVEAYHLYVQPYARRLSYLHSKPKTNTQETRSRDDRNVGLP
jgi:hypothetical protein